MESDDSVDDVTHMTSVTLGGSTSLFKQTSTTLLNFRIRVSAQQVLDSHIQVLLLTEHPSDKTGVHISGIPVVPSIVDSLDESIVVDGLKKQLSLACLVLRDTVLLAD